MIIAELSPEAGTPRTTPLNRIGVPWYLIFTSCSPALLERMFRMETETGVGSAKVLSGIVRQVAHVRLIR